MVDGQRTMDNRQQADNGPWLYYKLTNEPKGSGELKKTNNSTTKLKKEKETKIGSGEERSCSHSHVRAETKNLRHCDENNFLFQILPKSGKNKQISTNLTSKL